MGGFAVDSMVCAQSFNEIFCGALEIVKGSLRKSYAEVISINAIASLIVINF